MKIENVSEIELIDGCGDHCDEPAYSTIIVKLKNGKQRIFFGCKACGEIVEKKE